MSLWREALLAGEAAGRLGWGCGRVGTEGSMGKAYRRGGGMKLSQAGLA